MTAPFIMLVDDEVSFVEILFKRLGKRNIETITAFSGEECLEKLSVFDGIYTLTSVNITSEYAMSHAAELMQLTADKLMCDIYNELKTK